MKTSIQFGYSYFYKSIMQVASFLEATNSQPLLWSKAYWLLNTSPLSSPQPMPSVHAAQNPGQKHENTKGIVSENLWEAWAITLYSKQVITQHRREMKSSRSHCWKGSNTDVTSNICASQWKGKLVLLVYAH